MIENLKFKQILVLVFLMSMTSIDVIAEESFSPQLLPINYDVCEYRMTLVDGGYNFRTTKNTCIGGVYNQRNEVVAFDIPITSKGFFVFESEFSIDSERPSDFVIFQMHDGTARGCKPPLMIKAMPFGSYTKFDNISEYGKVSFLSKAICIPSDFSNLLLNNDYDAGKADMKFDGTPNKLRAEIALDGSGDYELSFYVNSKLVIEGSYTAAHKKGYTRSKSYYFKHGVYSRYLFDYKARTKPAFLRYPIEAKETLRFAKKPFGELNLNSKPSGCSDAAFAEMMGSVCE